jgi:hypothetical protein
MDETIRTITTQMAETEDEFIFQTLSDFALNNYKIVVEKEEFDRAIQLIRMSKVYGPSIDSRWETATQNAAELDRAYTKGFQDGVDKEHARIMAAMKEMEKKHD